MESVVEVLACQVDAMKKVFDDANVARERQREFLDFRHQTTLKSIDSLRIEISSESQRFSDTLAGFARRGEAELAETRLELQAQLKTCFSTLAARLSDLATRQDALDAAIQQEISDRKDQTARLVADLQSSVAQLDAAINSEVVQRTSDVKTLTKLVADRDEQWTRQMDEQVLGRELAIGQLSAQLTADLGRAHGRQVRLSDWATNFFRQLEFSLAQEAQLRGATEQSIVDSVTKFVEKFKVNLDREAH